MSEPGLTISPKVARVPAALEQISGLVRRLANHGLQRTTTTTVQEIRVIAAVAHHARLVRLERELERLAAQIHRYLQRDPSLRVGRVVETANRVWLLISETQRALATARQPADLEPVAGIPRRRYEPVEGSIEVWPAAAAGWVTESGYVGVTVHLWVPQQQRAWLATVVRPDRVVGPDPTRLLSQDVGGQTLRHLCHGAWILDGVKLSSDLRLSLHAGLSAAPSAAPGGQALEPLLVGGLDGIVDRLRCGALDPVTGIGTARAYLEAPRLGSVQLDETQARARSVVWDVDGRSAPLVVPIRPEHDVLIDNLELIGQGRWVPDGLVLEATLVGSSLSIRPLTAVYHEPVRLPRVGLTHLVHLTIEPLARAKR